MGRWGVTGAPRVAGASMGRRLRAGMSLWRRWNVGWAAGAPLPSDTAKLQAFPGPPGSSKVQARARAGPSPLSLRPSSAPLDLATARGAGAMAKPATDDANAVEATAAIIVWALGEQERACV